MFTYIDLTELRNIKEKTKNNKLVFNAYKYMIRAELHSKYVRVYKDNDNVGDSIINVIVTSHEIDIFSKAVQDEFDFNVDELKQLMKQTHKEGQFSNDMITEKLRKLAYIVSYTNLITSIYSLDLIYGKLFYDEDYIKEANKSYIKQANSIKEFAWTVYKNTTSDAEMRIIESAMMLVEEFIDTTADEMINEMSS